MIMDLRKKVRPEGEHFNNWKYQVSLSHHFDRVIEQRPASREKTSILPRETEPRRLYGDLKVNTATTGSTKYHFPTTLNV